MTKPKIIFTNQPKMSEDAVDTEYNKRRLTLIPVIENYLLNSKYFNDEETLSVSFAQIGVGSLVCIIESNKQKMVLKVPLSKTYANGEALFLKTWEKVGVKVPHVYDDGYFGDHPYTLMEYIDAPLLGDMYTHEEKIKKGIYLEMGRDLRKMHEPKGEGYGLVVEGKGEYTTFEEWLKGPDMQKRFDYVKEHNLLNEEHGSLQNVLEILIEHVNKETKISYCHNDFGNIFATTPLTIFDPNPNFNNRYLDIGRTMVSFLYDGTYPEKILDGYFENETRDNQVLQASIFLNTLMKLPYAHKKNRPDSIKNWQEFLAKNKNLLL